MHRHAYRDALADDRRTDPPGDRARSRRRSARAPRRGPTFAAASAWVSTSIRGSTTTSPTTPRSRRWRTDHGVTLRDVRKPPPVSELHFFSGKIAEVGSFKVADSRDRLGGRQADHGLAPRRCLSMRGPEAELVGTGQTAWLQGAQHSIVLDSLVNDFVAGEIEHAVWTRVDRELARRDRHRGSGEPDEPGLSRRLRDPRRRATGCRGPAARSGPEGVRRVSRATRCTRWIARSRPSSWSPADRWSPSPSTTRTSTDARSIATLRARSRATPGCRSSTCCATAPRPLVEVDPQPGPRRRAEGSGSGMP